MANRYWIGNSGNFSDTAHWSTSSNGTGGASVPTTGDTAVFDASSFPTGNGYNLTLTINMAVLCAINNSASKAVVYSVTSAGSLSLSSALTNIYSFDCSGSLTTNNYNITVNRSFSIGYPCTVCSLGTSTITVNGTNATWGTFIALVDAQNCPAMDAANATFAFTAFYAVGSNNCYMDFGCNTYSTRTYGTINISAVSGVTVTLNSFDTATIKTLSITGDGDILFGDGYSGATTTTISTSATFTGVNNYSLILRSASTFNLVKSSGTVTATKCKLIRAGASGGATFNALTSAGNEDGFYNTGWDFTGVNRVNELYEQATVNDLFEATSPTHYNDTLTESLGMVDGSSFYFTLLMEEIIMLYDELNPAWATSIIEALTLTDSLSTVMGLIISDWLTLIDSQTNNWNGREIVPDTLNLYDILQMGKRFSDTITESITITDIVTRALTIAVLEYLGFTELVNAIRSGSESVNDAVELSDSPAHVLSLLINDILFAVDVASIAALFMDTVQESIGLADAASLINRIGLTVTDPITFTETLTSHGTLYSAVYDTLAMDVTVEFSGEVWECYVLNTPKFMPSMYSGFDFNSYCVFENRAFGANDTGIYELTGTTDAGSPIHTGAILSETDFGAPNQKRFRHGYLGISGTNPVMVFETDDGSRQVYNIDTRGKVVASHELKAKKWKLSVADYESLDTIKLIPIVLTK